jgi:hypothetical protein
MDVGGYAITLSADTGLVAGGSVSYQWTARAAGYRRSPTAQFRYAM